MIYANETAWADAEGMEHRCSPETLAAFERFVKKNGSNSTE